MGVLRGPGVITRDVSQYTGKNIPAGTCVEVVGHFADAAHVRLPDGTVARVPPALVRVTK